MKNDTAAAERIDFPEGTRGFAVEAGQRLFGKSGQPLPIGAGDILFISPVGGRYAHVGDDGLIVIEGTLHGALQDV